MDICLFKTTINMIAEQYGKLIKEQRARRGLTQAALAEAAQVSRAVVSRLEQGKPQPVQTDTIERLLKALGVESQAIDRSARDAARRLARLEQQNRLVEQRNRHLRLAIELASDERAAPAKVARARERVALWRSQRSCSPFYINRWSRLLALPPRKMAEAMASLGEWEDALFQNSPWSWAWS
jgi:transcriptional regulator with XRE-family HTH domain